MLRSRIYRFAIDTAILHDCPNYARCFFGHRDRRYIGRPAPTQLCKPDPGLAPPSQYGTAPMDQKTTQIAVSSLADAAQTVNPTR
jgi:hypothetical protein